MRHVVNLVLAKEAQPVPEDDDTTSSIHYVHEMVLAKGSSPVAKNHGATLLDPHDNFAPITDVALTR